MEQYIPKSALVAEIERIINGMNLGSIEDWRYRLQREHDIEVMKNVLSLIVTLEPKKVDLEKELNDFIEQQKALIKDDWVVEYNNGDSFNHIYDLEKVAKHFFELGMQVSNKAQKEPVSEDLEKAAVEAFKQIVDSDKNNFLEIFKAGAEWKKQQTIEKACKWIDENAAKYLVDRFVDSMRITGIDTSITDDFRKDMVD